MKANFGIRCAGAEPLLYEMSKPGRSAAILPALDVPEAELPSAAMLRDQTRSTCRRSASWTWSATMCGSASSTGLSTLAFTRSARAP